MNEPSKEESWKVLASAHVDWWLGSVRQILIDNFVHGIKHGYDLGKSEGPAFPLTVLPLSVDFQPAAEGGACVEDPDEDDEGDGPHWDPLMDPGFPVDEH